MKRLAGSAILVLAAVVSQVSVRVAGEEAAGVQRSPTLRKLNYVALLSPPGQPMKLEIKSVAHTRNYGDELAYCLVGNDSNEIVSGGVPLDASRTLTAQQPASAGKDALCVLEIDSGWNICFFDSFETPAAFVASETHPLHTIREIERLYFYVPKGCARFGLFVLADVAGEGARIVVFSPEGAVVKEEEGDFNTRTQIKVVAPSGTDGKVWSLSVAKPKAPKLYVDDVALSLDPALPPFLAKRADWAAQFGRRKHK